VRTAFDPDASFSQTVYYGIFYTVSGEGTAIFRLGRRPKHLGGGKIPNAKDLKKYNAFQKRLKQSPLAKARDYQRRMQQMGVKSIRKFARETGEDWSVVARHLCLLKLPKDIIDYIDMHQTPETLRLFSLRKLDRLARTGRQYPGYQCAFISSCRSFESQGCRTAKGQ
jgi:hypothetical protein